MSTALRPFVESLGPFMDGDRPAGQFPLEFTEDGSATDAPAEVVTVYAVSPVNYFHPLAVERDSEVVAAVFPTWPGDLSLDMPGLWALAVQVDGASLRPLRFVVQARDGWHTLDSARDEWPDAENIADARLWAILETARTQVVEFAPTLAPEELPPVHYLQGQLMQARALKQSMDANGDGNQVGEGDYAVTVYPLDFTIRAVLRPKRATPGRI